MPYGSSHLAADAARSADRQQIMVLKARYMRFVDTKQWPALASLFAEDATFHFPEVRPELFGKAEMLKLIVDSLDDSISIHHGHMPEIEFHGPDRASGIWAMEDRIIYSPSARARHGLAQMYGFGHYHESYILSGENWLITQLTLTRLHKVEIPV